jgi:hypothetical protein
VKHSADDKAGVHALRSLPDDVGAAVSLCRVSDFDVSTTSGGLMMNKHIATT